MTEFEALVRGSLADLGAGPGALADWLEDRGDPRGVLLRRRWKRYGALCEAIRRGGSTRRIRYYSRSDMSRYKRAYKDFGDYICRQFAEFFAWATVGPGPAARREGDRDG